MTPLTIVALVYGACAVVLLFALRDVPDEYELWQDGADDPRPGEVLEHGRNRSRGQ